MTAIDETSNINIYNTMLPEIQEVTEHIHKGNIKTINNVRVYLENNSEILELKQRQWIIGPISSMFGKSMGLQAIYLIYKLCTAQTVLAAIRILATLRTSSIITFYNPRLFPTLLTQEAFIVSWSSLLLSYLWNVQTSKPSCKKVIELFNKALEKRNVNETSQTKLKNAEQKPDPIHCTLKVQVIQGSWLFGKSVDYETKKIEVLSSHA